MKILIIEDEKLTAKDLANTIKSVEPDAEILPLIYSVEDALDFLMQKPEIDLIFSDIELGDGLSFDVFHKIENKVPIIFCTAYQQYTLEAFNTAGIDYILKPFNKLSVEKTLLKYKNLKEKLSQTSSNFDAVVSTIKNNLINANPSIITHIGDKIIPINSQQIALFYVENDNTFIHTFDNKRHVINQKLEILEKMFSPLFFRANRQFLINRKAVKDASQYFNRKMLVNLTISFSEQIIIGKLKTTEFVKWLENN